MSFRLYESAWVRVEGSDKPVQARKDKSHLGAFLVGDFRYDIDARALPNQADAPNLLSILSLQAVREADLRGQYSPDGEHGG